MKAQVNTSQQSIFLIKSAALLLLTFALTHSCGGPSHVSALAGAHSGSSGQALIGLIYVCVYLLTLSVAPILTIAALIVWIPIPRRADRQSSKSGEFAE